MNLPRLNPGPAVDKAIEAYIANAQFHLDMLEATINDGLPGRNDEELKLSLLQDLYAAQDNLRKALL